MTPCTHGMPTPLACTECMAEGNIPPPHSRPLHTGWSRPLEARYAGRCRRCDDTIAPGDLIRIRDGAPAHDTCVEDNTP